MGLYRIVLVNATPYSLGKLIDWKRAGSISVNVQSTGTPYSLGKLIDWKLNPIRATSHHQTGNFFAPYSLGKLIDWKPSQNSQAKQCRNSPYSLGKLIDWKQTCFCSSFVNLSSLLAREIN